MVTTGVVFWYITCYSSKRNLPHAKDRHQKNPGSLRMSRSICALYFDIDPEIPRLSSISGTIRAPILFPLPLYWHQGAGRFLSARLSERNIPAM